MYHEFFGLKEPAFSIAVNPRYLYMSAQHREALAHLVYGIQNGGFVMLTGEVGTGKTTIIRCLLEQLPPNTDMAIILNPMASAPELLSTICDELGVSYIDDDLSIKGLTDALNIFLLENHRKGRKTVLLIDEAQLLKVPVLEQIRLLTNLETTTEKLLQIILVGQPELKKLLALPALRQLSQRITARFHLEALTLEETQAYISHRLSVAGLNPALSPFSLPIIKKIHRFSGGIPRLINVLCERLMLGAYAKHQHHIDNDVFRQAVREVSGASHGSVEESASVRKQPYYAAFASVLLILVVLIWWFVPGKPHDAKTIVPIDLPPVSELKLVGEGSLQPRDQAAIAATQASANNLSSTASVFERGWRELTLAQQALMEYNGVAEYPASNPCDSTAGRLSVCEKQKASSWNELREINRPALLTLVTPDKKWIYVLMVGLGENDVLINYLGQETVVHWSQLIDLWNGDVLYVWSRPADFPGVLQLGDQGPLVTWVAEQFARLDKQPAPLTRQYYTDKLKTRVELFQASHKMVPDGIFGVQTLRRLNEALGIDKTLRNPDPILPAVQSVQTSSTGGIN
ncbi:ExeA family protein [Cellvibrio japonicus]|nr:ExeA family protein [Cellvibrio japonicus]QEI11676.1 AAA family ATPase [Cellvibrio japonicus]QEI15250.1 AAA family ATPase [Cellvibrio japonicus]QEI18830.1 AAA family ATPase [Cellvibrio japonicus]